MTKQEAQRYNTQLSNVLDFAVKVTSHQKCRYCNHSYKKGTPDADYIREYGMCLGCEDLVTDRGEQDE